jgi:signal transduction histidine kinase
VSLQERNRIFEPFERGKATSGKTGLGLGLYICRRIVEAHAGTLTVESDPERGTTFLVELPIST